MGMAALRHPLVTAAPIRPDQDRPSRGRHPQSQVPQQTPDLRQAQSPARPRDRLKAARLFVSGIFFWGSGRARSAARTTASRASVTCRYQPRAAHFVVVQPQLLLGGHQRLRVLQAAAEEQVMAPVRGLRFRQHPALPVVNAIALYPTTTFNRCQNGL